MIYNYNDIESSIRCKIKNADAKAGTLTDYIY